MNAAMPEIPETATEEYLEKLAEKIHKRLNETDNKKVRKRLHALLETVEDRKQQLLQQTKTFDNKSPDTLTRTPFDVLETAELSPTQQDEIKARLENVLSDIKNQRSHTPQETLTRSFSQTNDQSSPPQTLLEEGQLTKQEYELVKQRMTEMLAEVREQQLTDQEPAGEEILDLGQELEIGGGEETLNGEELLDLGPEQEIDAFLDAQEFETLEFPAERDLPISHGQQEDIQKASDSDLDLDDDDKLSFEAACRRVGKGEALVLFEKIKISEREQLMVEAFKEHLTQMKGLKRQQVFDMQHLTSRSIRELEQIFKTYHLQGYLRAELNNIYNRLLNLRSRFSILQH